MSYKDKPQIKLYKYEDSTFVLKAIIDDYQELSVEHNLYSAGQFTITINYNIPNALLFERGLFVQFGNNPYDFGEIYSIQDAIGQDGKGSQIRTITGYDARYILKRRVIKNMNSNGLWTMTAKGELCLRNLIKDQCGAGAEAKRQLPINNVIPSTESAIGKEYSVSEQFSNLYEVCKTIATQSEIGWRIAFDGELTLEVYEGQNLSGIVKFDTNYESLANGDFSDSSESYTNAIYIGGKGQNDDRDIYEGEDGSPNGLDRFESWDNQSQMTTESEYETEAISMLTQYGQTLTMQGNGLAKCPYIFREQYNIGDIITVSFSGKSANAQILSVTEHWAWGSYDIQFSFGKPQNNLAEQLQLILRQIQKASDKSSSTDSVRWYTIPTDTEMPKADVTYNTIGFIGDVGSGATFTLYLDNEKTGAKTYHVWFKQLAGSGKLTLTTGKSGAVDLEFGVGTYVAIISVDENGNIVNVASTPTDVIQSGNSQPATSSGVANALSGKVNTDTYVDTNLNTLIDTGFYIVRYVYQPWNNLNYPTNHDGTMLVGRTPLNNLMQMFMSDEGQLVYVRNCTTNIWSSWKKVLTNDDITDTVASGNMNVVTSNSVAGAINNLPVDRFNLIMTDGNAHTYYVGKTEGAQIVQAYTNMYIRGGRVDNEYGSGIISIYGSNIIDGKLLLAMPNVTIIFTQRDNEIEMYVRLESYTGFALELAPHSRFNVNIQEVSQIEGNVIWNNTWKSIITTADITNQVSANNMNAVSSNAVANYALANSNLVPSVSKFLMSNIQDMGYPNIDGTAIFANDAGRDQARNGVRGVSNPNTNHQWPITSNATNDEFISLGGLQFYIDKVNDKVWTRFSNSVDMSDWKEL